MARRSLAVVLVSVLAAASAFVPRAASVRAEDPPAGTEPAAETQDPTGLLALRLPPGWKSIEPGREGSIRIVGAIAAWTGRLPGCEQGRAVEFDVFVSRESRRALQTLMRLGDEMTPVTDSTRTGGAWAEESFDYQGKEHAWCRCVERAGVVVVLRLRFDPQDRNAATEAAIRRLLDSVRLLKDPEPIAPPKGTKPRTVSGFVVWSSGTTKVEGLVASLAKRRAIVLKELKDKPVDATPPEVWVFDDPAARDVLRALGRWHVSADELPCYLPHARAIAVLGGHAESELVVMNSVWSASDQAIAQWFGGAAPDWAELPLRSWFGMAQPPDFDPRQLGPDWFAMAKARIGGVEKRLDRLMAREGRILNAGPECFTLTDYHAFLRTAKEAAPWRSAYRASLAAIRDSGDVAASRKSWEKTDFAAMEKSFVAWVNDRR